MAPPADEQANEQAFLNYLHATNYECAMCYEEFTEEHPPVILNNCRHVFGKECLEKWVNSNNDQRTNCPFCRTHLFDNDHSQVQAPSQAQVVPAAINRPQTAAAIAAANASSLAEIDARTNNTHDHFLATLPNIPSFNRKLWRRTSRHLTPVYLAAGKIITPEIDTVARIVLKDLLRHIDYVATVRVYDYRYLLERSLYGDGMSRLLTRKLMQWVMCMVMLSPLVPMEMRIIDGCANLIPDLHHGLGFDVVNQAVRNLTVANAPILQVLTMLLVDTSVECVCTELGAQWYISAEPSVRFRVAAARVKQKLSTESSGRKEAFRRLKVSGEEVIMLWQVGEGVARIGFLAQLRHMIRGNVPRKVLTKNTQPRRNGSSR